MGGPVGLDRWLARRRYRCTVAIGLLLLVCLAQPRRQPEWFAADRSLVRPISVGEDLSLHISAGVRLTLAGVVVDRSQAAAAVRWMDSQRGDAPLLVTREPASESNGAAAVYAYLPDGRLLNEELIELALALPDTQGRYALRHWLERLGSLAQRREPRRQAEEVRK